MEIINDNQAEKHRVQALVRLVADLPQLTQRDVVNLLQPLLLVEANNSGDVQSSANNTCRIAEDCGLIVENRDQILEVRVPPEKFETMPAFQQYMQSVVLGVTEEEKSNYLFNLFSAWYAVQNERVLQDLVKTGYDGPFNDQMFPDASTRYFNSTKLTAWRKWATFLGLGWPMRFGQREIIIPDATGRIRPLISELFPGKTLLPFGSFMERLALHCPELDGGQLFRYCWQASRGAEEHSRYISLMLSTALRTLDGLGVIRLEEQADALENWQLYPAQGNPHQQVTHIILVGA